MTEGLIARGGKDGSVMALIVRDESGGGGWWWWDVG